MIPNPMGLRSTSNGGYRIIENSCIPWRVPKNQELSIGPKSWLSERDRYTMNAWLMDRFGWKEAPIMVDEGSRTLFCHPSVAPIIRSLENSFQNRRNNT